MNDPRAVLRLPLPLTFIAFALAGCARTPWHDAADVALDPPPERTRVIDPIDLEAHSRQEPVTLDDATTSIETLLDAPAERPTPPAELALTIEDVRAGTLANNLDLQVTLIDPALAATSVDEEEARFESVFTASFNRSSTDSPVVLGTEGSLADFTSFSPGLRVPLRSGGTATLEMPFSKSSTNNPFSLLDPAYTSDLRFSISQPLLRNAGARANAHGIRIAKYQRTITDARTRLEAMRVLATADRAYWNLYAAQRELDVREKQYRVAMDQLDRARRRVDAGDVAQIEVVRAESGLAQRVESIIIARTALRRAERDLKRIINRDDLPLDGPTAITLNTPPTPVGHDLDADALVALALDTRMEMLELELQIAMDASTLDFERNRALPLVVLDYTYNVNGLGNTARKAFHQMNDHRFADWAFGLRAEIPLGNEAAEARVHRAVLQRLQRLNSRTAREQSIRQEIHDAVDQLSQSWQRIVAARHDAILAGRVWEGEQRQFGLGERTSTDVLDAAARLADAQSNEIAAMTAYQIAKIDLAFATGTLLGHGRVRWDAIDIDDLD